MFGLSNKPQGAFRNGWSAFVNDYAISGGWLPDGEAIVVADAAGGVTVFNRKSGEVKWSRKDIHDGGLLAISVHPNGQKFATVGQDGRILIWLSQEPKIEKVINLGKGWVENIAWSPDGYFLAASCSRHVYVYTEKGEEIWQTNEHRSTISTIVWSSKKELATACYGQVKFFDGFSGELNQKLEWKGSLVSMVLSADGDIVACGSQDNSVHFWRRSTEKDSKMSGYPFKPSALTFNDKSTLLATGGSEAVTIWNFEGNGPEGTSPIELDHHSKPITSLAFSNHGNRLVSGFRDGSVVLWEIKVDNSKSKLGVGQVADTVAKLYWRPDDRALATLDRQGGVTVWRI
jgi:WD40 repeat protein